MSLQSSDRFVVSSPYSKDVPTVDLLSYCRTSFATKHSKMALRDTSTGRSCTYEELEVRYEQLAGRLYEGGLRRGQQVAVFLHNCIEYPIVILSALRIGATLVLVNHLSSKGELARSLEMTECSMVVTSDTHASKVVDACKGIGHIRQVVLVSGKYPGTVSFPVFSDLGTSTSRPPQIPPLERISINPRRNIAVVLFSSGTTGLPKSVMLSHFNLVSMQEACRHEAYESMEDPDNSIIYQPMSHSYGFYRVIFCLTSGISIHVMPRFKMDEFLQVIGQFKIKTLQIVPPIAVMLCKSSLTHASNLSCVELIFTSAAPMGSELEKELKGLFKQKVKIIQGYALTENSGCVTITPSNDIQFDNPPPGTVGILCPNIKATIVDTQTKNSLGPNQPGEIWVSGPQVMVGYMNNPKATREAVGADGWLHTGDLGYYDDRGYFFVIDRLKELIKYNGFQVAPAELEALLLSHPSVADVAVIGIPDKECGELPHAWIVKKSNCHCTDRHIHEWLSDKVAPFKKLRGGVRFVETIPKSTSGKILRSHMKKQLLNVSKL